MNTDIPLYINDGDELSAAMLAPSTFYFLNGAEAFEDSNHLFLKVAFKAMAGFACIARALHLDKTIQVNQWQLPTNPAISFDPDNLRALTENWVKTYPRHAILIKHLQAPPAIEGYFPVKTRSVYLFDPSMLKSNHRRAIKKDAECLHGITVKEGFDPQEIYQLLHLYQKIYREKHSKFNPDYSEDFLRAFFERDNVTLYRFYRDQQLIGFYSLINDTHLTIFSLIGHNDTPDTYRAMMGHLLSNAMASDTRLHLSGGAGKFKTQRGAKFQMEVDYCYIQHLPWWQRLMWNGLGWSSKGGMFDRLAAKI